MNRELDIQIATLLGWTDLKETTVWMESYDTGPYEATIWEGIRPLGQGFFDTTQVPNWQGSIDTALTLRRHIDELHILRVNFSSLMPTVFSGYEDASVTIYQEFSWVGSDETDDRELTSVTNGWDIILDGTIEQLPTLICQAFIAYKTHLSPKD